tara:strand:+ start:23184 stop:23687 length:504 start_codon:yes stop_codon:yes gene_type:complete
MDAKSYPEYYQQYIDRIPEGKDPFELLIVTLKNTIKTLAMVSDDQANKGYAEGKWSIKEVVQHIIDTERIYDNRALSFTRGETNAIQGYDHNVYAANSSANRRSLKGLLEELKRLRYSTIDLFKSFSDEMLQMKGKANDLDVTPEQIMYILIGHELHHLWVIEQRYL